MTTIDLATCVLIVRLALGRLVGSRLVHLRSTRYVLSFCLVLLGLTACGLKASKFSSPTPTLAAFAEYIVQPGDTLGAIAARFQVTVQELVAANADRYPTLTANPGLVRVGWQLRVPTAQRTVTATVIPSAIATPANDVQHADIDETARLIVDGVNSARVGQGLAALRTDAVLTRIGSERSVDMISRDYFSHNDPRTGQEELVMYLGQFKYAYQLAGENIAELKNEAGWVPPLLTVAVRYSAADLSNEFVRGRLNSPEHRANILNGRFRRSGVSLAFSSDGRRVVATQIFSD